jgi:HEAT repeat protein
MTDMDRDSDGLDYNVEFDAESGEWSIEETPPDDTTWDDDDLLRTPVPVQAPIEDVVRHLLEQDELPGTAILHVLSDLSAVDAQAVQSRWLDIPLQRRRELVAGLVQDADDDFRLNLGRILRVALHDTDAQIRCMAIEALWEDDSGDLIGPLTHLLRTDPDTEVRAAAAAALGAFVLAGELDELDATLAMRAEEVLLSILRNEEEPIAVQCQALESIAYSGEVGVRAFIEDAYYSPYEEMRVAALNAMGRSADTRWRSLARAELANPSPAMRGSAAIACGELEAHAAVDELLPLLNDEEQSVRLAAIFALGRLGGKAAREALREVADSEYAEEAAAATDALEEMLFYASADEIPLFDESQDVEPGSDDEPWDSWFGSDDSDLGTYG